MDELLKAIIAALSLKEGTTEAEAIAALTALKPALDAQATNLAKLRETLGLAQDADVEQIAAATAQLKVAAPVTPTRRSMCPLKLSPSSRARSRR